MRAISAFLNGAGSRRNLKRGSNDRGGGTDRGLLKLTDLLVATGGAPAFPLRVRATAGRQSGAQAPARRSQRFPR
jgi:hypothetical protein